MWTIDEFGHAHNGFNKGIVIQGYPSDERFTVSLVEHTKGGGLMITTLKVDLPKDEARTYVCKLVDVLNSNDTAESIFVKIAYLNAGYYTELKEVIAKLNAEEKTCNS